MCKTRRSGKLASSPAQENQDALCELFVVKSDKYDNQWASISLRRTCREVVSLETILVDNILYIGKERGS